MQTHGTKKALTSTCSILQFFLFSLLTISGNKNSLIKFHKAHAASSPASSLQYAGVNEAGLEFGIGTNGPNPGTKIPGVLKTDYFPPSPDTMKHMVSKFANIFRIPFAWERLQGTVNGDFHPDYYKALDGAVNDALSAGGSVILDAHNYARYNGKLLGTDIPSSALADLWTKLAEKYKSNSKVIFCIMNEPHQIDTETWFKVAQDTVDAIRKTGSKNLIMIPGNCYTGAHSWVKGKCDTGISNAEAALKITDPADNFAFDMHQYYDSDYSGTQVECTVTDAASVFKDATDWLRKNKRRAFIGETGVQNNPKCLAALDSGLAWLTANSDVFLGYTYWAAGSAWGGYPYSVEPKADGSDAAQMDVLVKYPAGTSGGTPSTPATSSPSSASSSAAASQSGPSQTLQPQSSSSPSPSSVTSSIASSDFSSSVLPSRVPGSSTLPTTLNAKPTITTTTSGSAVPPPQTLTSQPQSSFNTLSSSSSPPTPTNTITPAPGGSGNSKIVLTIKGENNGDPFKEVKCYNGLLYATLNLDVSINVNNIFAYLPNSNLGLPVVRATFTVNGASPQSMSKLNTWNVDESVSRMQGNNVWEFKLLNFGPKPGGIFTFGSCKEGDSIAKLGVSFTADSITDAQGLPQGLNGGPPVPAVNGPVTVVTEFSTLSKRRRSLRGQIMSVRIAVLGDERCGKTALIQRLLQEHNAIKEIGMSETGFSETYLPTVSDSFSMSFHVSKNQQNYSRDTVEYESGINVEDDEWIQLELLDTSGSEEMDRFRPFAYTNSHNPTPIALWLICYDISNQASLISVTERWLPEANYFSPDAPILLVGCKEDLRMSADLRPGVELDHGLITTEQGFRIANLIGGRFIETSAKTGYNIENLFSSDGQRLTLSRDYNSSHQLDYPSPPVSAREISNSFIDNGNCDIKIVIVQPESPLSSDSTFELLSIIPCHDKKKDDIVLDMARGYSSFTFINSDHPDNDSSQLVTSSDSESFSSVKTTKEIGETETVELIITAEKIMNAGINSQKLQSMDSYEKSLILSEKSPTSIKKVEIVESEYNDMERDETPKHVEDKKPESMPTSDSVKPVNNEKQIASKFCKFKLKRKRNIKGESMEQDGCKCIIL